MAEYRPRSLSVVVPVFDEEANVAPLVERLTAAVRPLGLPFELVLVDDGSRDRTLERLRALTGAVPELVVIALRRNFGQTLALQAGLDRARGDAIVTLDGDLQNDPADIPRLLDALRDGAHVVSGWRRERQDAFLLRKLPSWIANQLIRRVSGAPIHDQGCSLKAYRGEAIRELDLYGDLHRFVALLTLPSGADMRELEVRHHPRTAGSSKYGIGRTFEVLLDLFTVKMLISFRDRPLRWFGFLGLPFALAGVALALLPLLASGGSPVWTSVALICTTTFGTCLLLGLLGEAVVDLFGRGEHLTALHHDVESRGDRG